MLTSNERIASWLDAEGIFNTVKTDIPVLLAMTRRMRENARGECLI